MNGNDDEQIREIICDYQSAFASVFWQLTEEQIMKTYYEPAPGEDEIEMCSRRSLISIIVLVIATGFAFAYLQGPL